MTTKPASGLPKIATDQYPGIDTAALALAGLGLGTGTAVGSLLGVPTGAVAGALRGNTAEGVGRGLIRGGLTGLGTVGGAMLGGMAGLNMPLSDPVDARNAILASLAAGAGLGGLTGWFGSGYMLGKPVGDATMANKSAALNPGGLKQQNALQSISDTLGRKTPGNGEAQAKPFQREFGGPVGDFASNLTALQQASAKPQASALPPGGAKPGPFNPMAEGIVAASPAEKPATQPSGSTAKPRVPVAPASTPAPSSKPDAPPAASTPGLLDRFQALPGWQQAGLIGVPSLGALGLLYALTRGGSGGKKRRRDEAEEDSPRRGAKAASVSPATAEEFGFALGYSVVANNRSA